LLASQEPLIKRTAVSVATLFKTFLPALPCCSLASFDVIGVATSTKLLENLIRGLIAGRIGARARSRLWPWSRV